MTDHDPGLTRSKEPSAARRALLERWKRGGMGPSSSTIPRVPRQGATHEAPLSSTQQRLWYLDQLVPGNPAYNVSVAFRLEGPLDVAALGRALTELVRRHETLRTTFPTAGGRTKQRIGAPFAPEIIVVELGDGASTQPRIEDLLQAEARQLISLEQGPLFATRLFRLGPEKHVFQFTIHHIVVDVWSFAVLNRELVTLYGAYAEGKPSPLPELAIQYADFAAWQQRRLIENAYASDLDFWKRELAGLTTLSLATDLPRPPVQTFRGARIEFVVPEALTDAIREMCRREDVTPYMFFLAAFSILLSRYSGQHDIVVGSPIANRTRVETEGIVGFFANTIPLRTDLSGDPSFRDLLGRIRNRSVAAFEHQDLPFEQLVSDLAVGRDTSRNPIFQVMMVLQNIPLELKSIAGLDVAITETHLGTAKFDLWLQWAQTGKTWTATLEYATDLFHEATITRMSHHLTRVLGAVTKDPGLTVSAIPLLDEEERQKVLVGFNSTSKDYGDARLLHEHIEEQVRRTPDRIAVSFEGQTLTYRTLDERANQLAHFLVDAGVGPDTLVGVYAERSVNLVVALLGILKSGGAYVPMDPSYPDERIEHMIRDAAIAVLLTDDGLPPRLSARIADLTTRIVRLGDVSRHPTHAPAIRMSPERLAYVIYTSGSTGLPKGAMNSHRGICNRLHWMQDAYGLGADDRVLQKTPFSFDVSVWEFFWPLMTGARLVVARPGGHRDPAYLVETILHEGITTLHFVPSMLQIVLDHPRFVECTSLTRVVCSGEALPAEFRDRFFAKLPSTELHNLYGPTEAAVDVTFWQCRKEDTSPVVPIGKPIANTQIYILDDHGQPVPIGVPGELCIGGTNVGRGYLHRPQLDAERFVRDPFASNEQAKMYRTGDLARWLPSGDIEFMGRLDSQVKLRGLRIELGEIEHALRKHPHVADAAAIVYAAGDEHKQLAAYVVPSHEARESLLTTQEHVAHWEGVFDTTYESDGTPSDPTLNLAGWNSSYDGKPIPAEEMREWVDRTVERILEAAPARGARKPRVLEIGCGTGLLLLRVAPHCEHYVGTDASEAGLRYLRPHVAGQKNVALEHRAADHFDGLGPGSFDTIVLNSVVQYFPSAAYLERVLAGCLSRLADGGTIFLGDIRDLSGLDIFHGSVEIANAGQETRAQSIRQRIDRRLFQDNELALSPLFFYELQKKFPRITGARVLLKRGRATNELTRFRYDVYLHVHPETGAPGSKPTVEWTELDWSADELSLAKLVELLPDTAGMVHVRRVPNGRLAADARVLDALKHASPEERLELVLEQGRAQAGGEEPESFFALESHIPYRVDVLWTGFDGPEHFDVVLAPRAAAGPAIATPRAILERDTERLARHNDPLHAKLARKWLPELRAYLGDSLPEFMIPSAFVLLDRLPVSPNGKLDRDALPPPIRVASEAKDDDAPRTPAEEKLAAIWAQVLGLERVGVETSFFELGGDSVLSMQVVARASEAGMRVTPGDIVRYQSIRELAANADAGAAVTAVAPPRPLPELPPDVRVNISARAGEVHDAYPLTAYQGELLRQRRAHPHTGLYVQNVVTKLRVLSGDRLDVRAVRDAWQAVAERHPTFRSSFQWESLEEPFQVVHGPFAIQVEHHDVSALSPTARQEEMTFWLRANRARPFVLDRPGHVRLALFQSAPDEAHMLWLYNYMFSDGWSVSFVLGDFLHIFDAILRKAPPALPPLNPYRHYIEYQRALDLSDTEAFWRRTMASFEGVTPLVEALGGRACSPSQGGAYIRKDRTISAEATTALRSLARNAHITLNNLIQAAWALILARWTGCSRVSFGNMMSGRSGGLEGYEQMAGIFTGVVPMEVPVSRDRLLVDWVREIQRIQADLNAHQHASLSDVRRWSGRAEDAALFESCFVFVNFPFSPVLADEDGPQRRTELQFLGGQTQTEHPLRLVGVGVGPTLDLQFFYYERQLPEKQVDRLIEATCEILQRLSGLAESRVGDVLASIRRD